MLPLINKNESETIVHIALSIVAYGLCCIGSTISGAFAYNNFSRCTVGQGRGKVCQNPNLMTTNYLTFLVLLVTFISKKDFAFYLLNKNIEMLYNYYRLQEKQKT